jgi:hypothetical protein
MVKAREATPRITSKDDRESRDRLPATSFKSVKYTHGGRQRTYWVKFTVMSVNRKSSRRTGGSPTAGKGDSLFSFKLNNCRASWNPRPQCAIPLKPHTAPSYSIAVQVDNVFASFNYNTATEPNLGCQVCHDVLLDPSLFLPSACLYHQRFFLCTSKNIRA